MISRGTGKQVDTIYDQSLAYLQGTKVEHELRKFALLFKLKLNFLSFGSEPSVI